MEAVRHDVFIGNSNKLVQFLILILSIIFKNTKYVRATVSKDRPDTYLNDRLDWNLLRTFLAIAREKSVSRAAVRLHLTQPAVSQALRRLEEQLNLRLVDRHGPRIAVTQAGIEVQKIAEDIYGTISRLTRADVDADHDISGTVRIAMVSGVDFPAYDDFLAEFHRDFPRIEFESQVMRSADVVNSLQQKASTIGLTPRRALPKRIDGRIFQRERYALFCGRHHPLFDRDDIRLDELTGQPFVSFSGDKLGDHMSLLTIFRDEMGLTGPVIATSANMAEVRRFIFSGFGIGCMPEHIVRNEVAQGQFRQLPPDGGVADVDIHFLWAEDRRLSAAESAFVDALNAFLDEQAAPVGKS